MQHNPATQKLCDPKVSSTHAWGEWEYEESYRAPVRRCRRCGAGQPAFAGQAVAHRTVETPVPAMPLPDDSDVARLVQIVADGDMATIRAFIAQLAPAITTAPALPLFAQADLAVNTAGLNLLAIGYCQGLDAPLACTLSRAAIWLAQHSYEWAPAPEMLFNVGQGAINLATALITLGQHQISCFTSEELLAWLAPRRDYAEYATHKAALELRASQAHFNLANYDDVGRLLAAGDWNALSSADQHMLAALRKNLRQIAQQPATELPKPPDDRLYFEQQIAGIRQQIELMETLGANTMSYELNQIIATLRAKADVAMSAKTPPSLAEWAVETHSLMAQISTFLAGNDPQQQGLLANQQRIRAALLIFHDPAKAHDPVTLRQSAALLREARAFAGTHNALDDQHNALWGLYLCYSRTEQTAEAIEALQALRLGLERLRAQIGDSLRRAGVFQNYPYLFPALCAQLFRAGRPVELLDAIEGAKGRVIADVLAARQAPPVAEQPTGKRTAELPALMRRLQAHYLSYYVTEEATFAVLVAKDGSLHTKQIALGAATLRALSAQIDPLMWTLSKAALFGSKPVNLAEQLAPLVDWLEPLAERGVIAKADHLCYCPDDMLHLVPLQYLLFQNKPLACYMSLSRIHSAATLFALMEQAPQQPQRFTAICVPAAQDMGEKREQFARVPRWLGAHIAGRIVDRLEADVATVTQLDLRGQLVHFATHGTFPKGDNPERDSNPFSGSGLRLIVNHDLPDLLTSATATNTWLTPAKALGWDIAGASVTMQACVSGLASPGIGGDALGLEWALIQAGAVSLLSTHWNVDVTSSAEFCTRFYENWLLLGLSRAEAWRTTILALIDRQVPLRDWAPFSLSGDWR